MEWVAIPFSRGSSWLRGRTWVSCSAGGLFTEPPGVSDSQVPTLSTHRFTLAVWRHKERDCCGPWPAGELDQLEEVGKPWQAYAWFMLKNNAEMPMQAHPGDTEDFVPGQCNKVNISLTQARRSFLVFQCISKLHLQYTVVYYVCHSPVCKKRKKEKMYIA